MKTTIPGRQQYFKKNSTTNNWEEIHNGKVLFKFSEIFKNSTDGSFFLKSIERKNYYIELTRDNVKCFDRPRFLTHGSKLKQISKSPNKWEEVLNGKTVNRYIQISQNGTILLKSIEMIDFYAELNGNNVTVFDRSRILATGLWVNNLIGK